jgi:hypothetical protein
VHEGINQKLRVYRLAVLAALCELRKAGIIAVDRERIRIRDRLGLERPPGANVEVQTNGNWEGLVLPSSQHECRDFPLEFSMSRPRTP